jgi:hypothetical protein
MPGRCPKPKSTVPSAVTPRASKIAGLAFRAAARSGKPFGGRRLSWLRPLLGKDPVPRLRGALAAQGLVLLSARSDGRALANIDSGVTLAPPNLAVFLKVQTDEDLQQNRQWLL